MPPASRHRRRRLATVTTTLLLSLLGVARAGDARAQALLERFDPAERGSRFFVADSLELDGNLRLTTGAVVSYAHGLRTFRQSGPDPTASELVSNAVWIHAGASLVLAPGARLALDLPFALQTGRDVALDRTTYTAPGSPRLGDLRASFDLAVLGDTRPDVDGGVLAIGVSAYLPTGSGVDYASDDAIRFSPRVAGAVRLGRVALTSRLSYMYRREDAAAISGVNVNGELGASLGASYRFASWLTVGPELYGSTTFGSLLEKTHTPIEGLLGSHLTFGHFSLGAGIGTRLVGGLGSPDVRSVVSIEWANLVPGKPGDRDHDGVLDPDDVCPDLAGIDGPGAVARGCPPPPSDRDEDSVFDTDDACPDLRGLRTNDPTTHGCPDADRDGIPDPADACVNIPGDRGARGCPMDSDHDGVIDLDDACPDEPGVATSRPKTNGCPAAPTE